MIKRVLTLCVAISMSACLAEEPDVDGEEEEVEEVGQSADAACFGVPAADETCANSATCETDGESLDGECDFAAVQGTWSSGNRYTQAVGSARFGGGCSTNKRAEMTVWGRQCAGQLCTVEWEVLDTAIGTSCEEHTICAFGECLTTSTVTVSDTFASDHEQVRVGIRGKNGTEYDSFGTVAKVCKTGTLCVLAP